jgi:hypothetical protein
VISGNGRNYELTVIDSVINMFYLVSGEKHYSLVVEHHFFFFVPRSVSKLAASTQALITLGSPSPHPAHLSSLSSP